MSMHAKHMARRKRALAAVLLGTVSLQACSTFGVADDAIKSNRSEAIGLNAEMNDPRTSGAVVRHHGQKIAGEEVLIKARDVLPAVFSQPFSYLSAAMPLTEVLAEVARRVGMTADIQPNVESGPAGGVGMSMVAGSPAGMGGLLATPAAISSGSAPIAVDWQGSLKGLLDYLALRADMYWKYDEGRIYFYRTETRNFNIYLPSGKRKMNSSISLSGTEGSEGGGGSGSEGGTVDVSSEMEVDAYDAIVKSVSAMVAADEKTQGSSASGGAASSSASGSGSSSSGNVIANPALGIITVTANPRTLERVESYLKGVNDRFAQNVLIGVKIYNVTLKQDANLGASLSLAYRDLARKYGVNLTGMPPLEAAAGTPGQIVIDALAGSRITGSSLLMQAMEQVGNVSLLTSGQVITANGQPSPLQVATDHTYLASSSTTQAANIGTTTSLTPGSVTVGFTANFLPMILGDNRILLQYQMNLSSLIQLNQVSSGSSMIQTPSIQKHDLQQHAFVRDGQSLVLFGFEQERSTSDSAKGMTGFGRNAAAERSMMVIVLEVHSGK